MGENTRYADTPIDPTSLNGINHADIDLSDRLAVDVTFDALTNSDYRLYWRLDQQAAAGGTTRALFKPNGFLVAGQTLPVTVNPSGGWYLHLLLTDSTGAAANGGADDMVLLAPWRCNP